MNSMQRNVFAVADNIISPLGFTSEHNFIQIKNGISGISLHSNAGIWPTPFQASLFDKEIDNKLNNNFSRFENLLIESVNISSKNCTVDLSSSKTIFIISTTKGNIGLLEKKR